MRCPKCESENTTRVPIELLDGTGHIWFRLAIFLLFGVIITPAFLVFEIIIIIITIIINITKKIAYREKWIMQCSRCGTEFTIVNPDKADRIRNSEVLKENKAYNVANADTDNNVMQMKKECLSRNGQLAEDEVLIKDIEYFGFHKNAFSNSQGKLRITNKSLICYNDKGCFRIPKDKIIAVKKKNYFFVIPTGIQIKVNDKRKKYYFVVYPKDREEILKSLTEL